MERQVGRATRCVLVLLLFVCLYSHIRSNFIFTKSTTNMITIPYSCSLKSLNGSEAILYAISQKHRSFVLTAQKKFDCVKLPHFTMCIYDKSSDNVVSQFIRDNKLWEADTTQSTDALKMYPNAQFIDIGGYIGWHSFHAVATMNRSAVIVDPFVDNIYLMGSTLVRNKFNPVQLFPYCVYSDRRNFNATIDSDNPGATPIDKKLVVHVGDKFTAESLELNCVTLDDIADCIDFTQAVMKIDIERSEFAVFTSNTSSALFSKIDIPVVFMEWGHLITLSPDAAKLTSNFFLNLGYSPYQGKFSSKQSLDKTNSNGWPFDIFWVKPSKTSLP